jgi:hypothetical protein
MCNHLESVDTIELDDITINIYPEEDLFESPRDWDNLGTMVCFHRHYNLGDEKHGFNDPDELTEYLKANIDKIECFPVYLMDHSGLSMRAGAGVNDFLHVDSHGWDWGCVGYIFVTHDTLRKEYSKKRLSKKVLAQARKILLQEVETYDQCLTGDVYWYTTTCNHCNEQLDSCGGFYGHDWKENGLLEYAKNSTCNCLEDAKQAELQLSLALAY